MGKNGFTTLVLLTFFVVTYSMVPTLQCSAPILPQTKLLSDQANVQLQLVPSLGLPAPMWDYTFGRDDGWADAWDIIQLHQSDSMFFGTGFLYIAGTYTYDPSSDGSLPYFATFSMPPDDTYCSFSHGSSYGNSTLSEAHSVVQANEGIIAIAGAVDWLDDKSRAYMQVYYNGGMTPDSFYNGSVSDAAWSIIEHYPRAFVIAGVTESFGAGRKDVWLLHTDSEEFCTGSFGEHTSLLWNRTFGGLGDDEGRCVVNCTSGGFAITGFTDSFGAGGTDGWLVRTDADGNHLWNRTYGSGKDDELYSIIECQSGGFAMIGTSGFGPYPDMWSTMWVIRTNEYGNILWQKFFGAPSSFCRGHDLVEFEDGTFALAGSIQQGSFDMWLVRLAADGSALSFQTFGGSNDDEARSITEVASGGVALAGYTQSFGDGYRDVWIVRVPEDYPPQWNLVPYNKTIYYNSNFLYKFRVSDASEIDQWWINNTVDFAISSEGTITNSSVLAIGNYPLLVNVSDVWGNTASAVFNVIVLPPVPEPIPVWSTVLLTFVVILLLSAPFVIYPYLKQRRTK